MASLTIKEVKTILSLATQERVILKSQLDGLEARSEMSNKHKKILLSALGKNYFKTKTSIKKVKSELFNINQLIKKVRG